MNGDETREGLSDKARAALKVVLDRGEATRRIIGEDVGISLATVTYLITELEAAGLLVEIRREQGALGRSTLVLGVAPSAGWVLGVDIGSTQASYLARRLDGTTIASHTQRVAEAHSLESARQAAGLTAELLRVTSDSGPLLAVAIAVNHIAPRSFDPSDISPMTQITCDVVDTFLHDANIPKDVPILVENNVNCGAVAEHDNGVMQGHADCAYMQIGVRMGLGFFADGILIRGGHGAGGELAQIPLSWSADVPPSVGAIEQAFSTEGLLATAVDNWPAGEPVPESTEDLFLRAQEGHPVAADVIRRHAVALARVAVAAATVIDPDVLVVGGGLSRATGFVDMMQQEFDSHRTQVKLVASEKGSGASVEGAVILARDLALSRLLYPHHHPLLPRPALYLS